MNRHHLLTSLVVLGIIACTGGGESSSSSGSSGTSGSSGSSGSSGTSGSSGSTGPCTEFTVGAPVNASIGGSVASQIAVQSISDYAATAATSVDAATTTCKKIAQGLDASQTAQDAADGTADKLAKMKAWCTVAESALKTMAVSAGGSISIIGKAPQCDSLVSVKSECQGKCAGSVCDIKANPPKCTGGRLIIECKGSCTALASATVYCEGSCAANCAGTCVSPEGVECAGKCNGTCSASSTGTGTQTDGTCKGLCKGTCAATAPSTKCNGTCNGDCSATCSPPAGAPGKCDGECDGDFTPITCHGGKLEGGCQVEARCDASCDVTTLAKANCPTPDMTVSVTGAQNTEAANKLRATLEANLGGLLALKSLLQGMANVAGTMTAGASSITDIKASCIPPVIKAASDSTGQVAETFKALTSVAAASGAQ